MQNDSTNSSLLAHVFGSVMALEKCLANTRDTVSKNGFRRAQVLGQLERYGEVVEKMRQTANHLQLAIARKNSLEIVRLLQVIYGLNHMVRPEILSTFVSVLHSKPAKYIPAAEASLH